MKVLSLNSTTSWIVANRAIRLSAHQEHVEVARLNEGVLVGEDTRASGLVDNLGTRPAGPALDVLHHAGHDEAPGLFVVDQLGELCADARQDGSGVECRNPQVLVEVVSLVAGLRVVVKGSPADGVEYLGGPGS
jgi:hypothetical protein